MFKKLVSNLPFNPSLLEHLPEYRESLRKERDLRAVGLTILVIAFAMQIFISAAPAQPALTSSPNDIINGGFNSRSQAVAYCGHSSSFRAILSHYSISCTDISYTATTIIHSTSYNKNLYSLNRIAYGQNPEIPVKITSQTYYLRLLWKGEGLSAVNLKALRGTSASGLQFFILYNSGDLAFIGQPAVSANCNPVSSSNCPQLFITARSGQINDANRMIVQPSSEIIYTLTATNLSKQPINNFVMDANFSSAMAYSRLINIYGGEINGNFISWPATSIMPSRTITNSVSFTVWPVLSPTPLSSTDSNYYNDKMTTVYGNAVTIKLPMSFAKFYELKVNNNFPSQPALISLIISGLLIILFAYFLARNLLMLRELYHVKEDYLNDNGN